MYLKPLCDEINKVKNFLLFKNIFKLAKGKDKVVRYNNALYKLKMIKNSFEETNDIKAIFNSEGFEIIFENIKDELCKKNEYQANEFIEQMIQYFNIRDKDKIRDLIILIKSKKYEIIVKSI